MLRVIEPVVRPVLRSVVGARRNGGAPVSLPEFDYLVTLGSSTTYQLFTLNPILGRQHQAARKAFTDAGFDVPVIDKSLEGATIANLDTNVNTYLTQLGPISAAAPERVAVVVNIGSNDIGTTDYDAMAPATRGAMLAGLNSIVTKIQAFGFTLILATSNSRKGFELLYQEWAEKFYRPAVLARTPFWYIGPLAVFDYSQFYFDNKDVPDWWNPDNTHPWMATGPMQAHTIGQLASKSVLPAVSANDRALFYFPSSTQYTGGFNAINAAAAGSISAVYDSNGALIPGAAFSWSGAAGSSGSVRPNPGVFDITLAHASVQGCTMVATGTITFTAAFGAAFANLTGVLRVTGSSSTAGRLTKITAGANFAVLNASGPGVQIVEIPFAMDAAGTLVFTAAPQSPSTYANVSGGELVFD